MNPYQVSDPNLLQTLQNGQLQKTHLDFRMEGGKVQVTENVQFKKEMEQNIQNHFNFMLRIAFYQGVFDEVTNFIGIYQQQFSKSTELYEYWKEIDKITDSVELQVLHAKERKDMIEEYNEAPVQMEEFNEFKKQMSFAFLDKEFRIQSILQNQEEEKARAEFKADAITTIKEGKQYLEWLKIQKPKQQKFKEDLDVITQQWNDQYQIYVAGRTFIENIDRNQVAIFVQKSWQSDNWISQLQDQIHNTIPFFEKLYNQYLQCLHYYMVLCEFKENVLVNQEIKENLIETAIRVAEKPFIEKFLIYFCEKEEKAIHLLNTLQTIDQSKRLLQVSRNINEQIFLIEKAFNAFDIKVTTRQDTFRNTHTNTINHQIEYVSEVILKKNSLNLHYENPDAIEWDPRTIEQMQILSEIQLIKQQLNSKLDRLDFLKKRYQELKQLPQQIELKYKLEFESQIQQGQIKKAQFALLLKQSEQENYDNLTYSQQSMPLLLGAMSKNIVIKKNTLCMCLSRQLPHNSDDIYYEDYVGVVASEIRNMKRLENKWLTSNEERVNQTKDLPVIKSVVTLMINNSILGALRNDDGQRQIQNRQRKFCPYASIAKTIQELCHLVIVDEKQKLNLTSATVNEKILNWTMTLQDAKIGKLATNYSLPIAGPQ